MYYLRIKDQKYRNRFKKFEMQLKLKKFIKINFLAHFMSINNFTANEKKKFYFLLLKKQKNSFLTRVVRRCVLTNRSKSLQFLKISRMQSKELISFGIIPGYKKAVW